MNKPNLFKRKIHSHNENTPPENPKIFSQTHKQNSPFRPYHHSASSWNQNSHNSNSQHNTIQKFTSPARRLKTEQFQIEPFSQIDNFMHFSNKTQNEDSFIKTRRAKLYPKKSMRQTDSERSSSKRNGKFETNFEILKKEIQQLENSQILRGTTGIRQPGHESFAIEPFDINGDKEWKRDDGFIATKEFSCGKNISLMQKQRQNIKKVMKNKKFRNYINLHKKNNQPFVKKDVEDSITPKISDSLLNETFSKSFISLNPQTSNNLSMIKSEQLKKKQTPQIVKKYYRPQSCNNTRQVPSYYSRPKKMKVELANFMSFNSYSKSCEKRPAPKMQLTQTLYNQTIQKTKKNKELVILCL